MASKSWYDFREIKQHGDFLAVLAHYDIEATGKGAQRKILCPFHQERKPSCTINLERRLFHCFGCEAGGDLLDFVMRKEACTAADAARIVATCSNIAPVAREGARQRAKSPPEARQEPRTGKTSSNAEKPLHGPPVRPGKEEAEKDNKPLPFTLKLDPAHPYLALRGVTPELAATFGLGACEKGLLRGRICIPIHNEAGELVAYAGRWPADDGWPEGEEKYKLPPNFKKSRVLFNLHRVEGATRLALVEGYWSVFRLHALGIPAVALMGRSLSGEQEELLTAHGADRLILLLDGDAPGRAATAELLPRLARRFFVLTPSLPDGSAPDTVAAVFYTSQPFVR